MPPTSICSLGLLPCYLNYNKLCSAFKEKGGWGNESRPLWGRFQWKGWLLFCGYWGNETSTGAYTMSEWKKFKASTRRVLSYSKAFLIGFQSQLLCLDTNVQVNTSFQGRLFILPVLSQPFISRSVKHQGKSNKWFHSSGDMSKWEQREQLQLQGAVFLASFLLLRN